MECSQLVFERGQILNLDRLTPTEERDNDGESHGNFGGSNGENKENENVAIQGAVEARKRDERERRGDQHELKTHVDDERILAQKNAEEPDREQQNAQNQIRIETHG